MPIYLLIANAFLALCSIAAALLALFSPCVMSRSSQAGGGERFYAAMYASRAIPAGMATAAVPIFFQGGAVQILLVAAAAMQLGDAAIGLQRKEWGMVVTPLAAAAVHAMAAMYAG